MKRMFWLGVGLAAGAYLTRRATEAAHNLTPAGLGANLADGLRELGAGIGAFGAEVRAGMQAREQELTALLERRTGAGVPTLGEALSDPTATPAHAWAPQNSTAQNAAPQNAAAQNAAAQNAAAQNAAAQNAAAQNATAQNATAQGPSRTRAPEAGA